MSCSITIGRINLYVWFHFQLKNQTYNFFFFFVKEIKNLKVELMKNSHELKTKLYLLKKRQKVLIQ